MLTKYKRKQSKQKKTLMKDDVLDQIEYFSISSNELPEAISSL